MFLHDKRLQFTVRVDKPDPVLARQVQELLGGKYGEMTVMMQYLMQGWGMRGDLEDPRVLRLKDMLLSTGTEEIAHVEMLSTCIAMLLEGTSQEQQEEAAKANPVVEAALGGGVNPQHIIVSGLGALLSDSNGNPWSGSFATASGNAVADLYNNAQAEMNGRLQACRVYELSTDSGVRDMLSFMIARDHMHQIQWLAAIEDFGGVQAALPVPGDFPIGKQMNDYAFTFMGYAANPAESAAGMGRWATGPSIDGKGDFNFMAEPFAVGEIPHLAPAPNQLHVAPPGGYTNDGQTVIEKVATKVKETLS
jgi:Mn-containing catalase